MPIVSPRAPRTLIIPLSALAAAAAPAFAQATFRPIPLPANAARAVPWGISADGSVVVGDSEDAVSDTRAWRWTAAGTTMLPILTGYNASEIGNISSDGQTIIGTARDLQLDESQACRWTASGTAVAGLGDIPGGFFYSQGWACSANGSVVVGTGDSDDSPAEAFRRVGTGAKTGLGFLPEGDWSEAYHCSADGSVVVGTSTNFDFSFEAFRWTTAGMAALGMPAGCFESSAYAVSADGLVAVGEGIAGLDGLAFRAFRWAGGSMTTLPWPAGFTGNTAFSTNQDGSVIVGAFYDEIGHPRAMIWDAANGSRLLQSALADAGAAAALTGWTLLAATTITPDGRWIVGVGTDAQGREVAWRASLTGAGPTNCYANCDSSTTAPVLNVQDFGCFLTKYAAGDAYANCDASTQPPVLNVQDFGCFLSRYAAGCP